MTASVSHGVAVELYAESPSYDLSAGISTTSRSLEMIRMETPSFRM